MKKLLFFVLIISLGIPAFAANGFSTLQERMSGSEFQATGLGKLTEAELAALNDWLREHSVATLSNAGSEAGAGAGAGSTIAGGDMRGFKDAPKDEVRGDVISGNIDGTFNGWAARGDLFKLTNGMIFQQVEKDSYYVEPVENPAIIIERKFGGKWHLSVVGHKKSVKVLRIQ